MLVYVARRLLVSVPVLLASSVLVFLMVANSGDPLSELKERNPPVPEQVLEARRSQLHLDRPLPERYWHQYTVTDYTLTFAGFVFLSMPVFWLAALLKEFGAIRLNQVLGRQWVFVVGDQSPNLTGPLGHRLADDAGHLLLPTVAIALGAYAGWSRFQRDSLLEALGSDHLRLARAKGLPRWRVTTLHALRNALAPLVTVVAIDAAGILGGVFVVEQVFSWHGMGELFVQGLLASDMNVVLACLTVSSAIVILFNLLADILCAVLDPRIRAF